MRDLSGRAADASTGLPNWEYTTNPIIQQMKLEPQWFDDTGNPMWPTAHQYPSNSYRETMAVKMKHAGWKLRGNLLITFTERTP